MFDQNEFKNREANIFGCGFEVINNNNFFCRIKHENYISYIREKPENCKMMCDGEKLVVYMKLLLVNALHVRITHIVVVALIEGRHRPKKNTKLMFNFRKKEWKKHSGLHVFALIAMVKGNGERDEDEKKSSFWKFLFNIN